VFYSVGFVLNPMIGAAIMSLSSISVLGNALRLKLFKTTKGEYKSMLLTYKVKDMTCKHCVKAIKTELATVSQIKKIKINLRTKELAVKIDTNVAENNKVVIKKISDLGYDIISL
jgi:Cu+-exporting ATPase